jgi:hypothetical protein
MKIRQKLKSRFGFLLVGYLVANVIIFLVDPYASRWHYGSHEPVPIEVMMPKDSEMSLSQITKILDSIDLAYSAREPTQLEQFRRTGEKVTQVVFLPSSIALIMKGFLGYMGPANSQQMAFTLSVKRRYNHLARLAIDKGLRKDGFLFQEDPSLSKNYGQSFISLRTDGNALTAK